MPQHVEETIEDGHKAGTETDAKNEDDTTAKPADEQSTNIEETEKNLVKVVSFNTLS